MRVYKYRLLLAGLPQTLPLPTLARPLHVAVQDGELTLWALVDPAAPPGRRQFLVCGTGQELGLSLVSSLYLGTATSGAFVWHVFEVWPS